MVYVTSASRDPCAPSRERRVPPSNGRFRSPVRRTGISTIEQAIAPDLLHTLGGVLALKSAAFVGSVALKHAPLVALLIVLSAGVSTAIGQSIVLFANRVRPARFAFSIAISALLFMFGYAFLTLSTWAVAWLFGEGRASLGTLWIVMALSYAPIVFSFLESIPYLGILLAWALRAWFLLAVVVGVAAVEHSS